MMIVFRLLFMVTLFVMAPQFGFADTTLPPMQEIPLTSNELPDAIQIEQQTNRFLYEFLKMLALLGGLIVLLLAANWYIKRLGSQRDLKTNEDSLIKVIEKRTLSPRSIVYLLEIEGKSVLIGETPHGLVRLSEKLD